MADRGRQVNAETEIPSEQIFFDGIKSEIKTAITGYNLIIV